MVTKEQASTLKTGDYIYYIDRNNRLSRAKVSGVMKTWKKRPGEFWLPCKHSLYTHLGITKDNAKYFFLTIGEALKEYIDTSKENDLRALSREKARARIAKMAGLPSNASIDEVLEASLKQMEQIQEGNL